MRSSKHDESRPLFIVGIGASAGGLRSLEGIVSNLEPNPDCCVIIIQHLSAEFDSLLPEILSRWTEIPVISIEAEMPLEGGSIYVAPPGKRTIIHENRFLVSDREGSGIPLPIDECFRSIALAAGRFGIGIIVSGTGSDGTQGVKSIAANEGLVIAETPESAKFDGMPQSVIGRGVSHLVLRPDAIPGAIDQFLHTGIPADQLVVDDVVTPDRDALSGILSLLHERFGIDFRDYKQTTVFRRIRRRSGLNRCDSISEYLRLVQHDSDELARLKQDLLIGVTSFFRDGEVFESLYREQLRKLVVALPDGHQLRVWVVGCATGEEAYSYAILIHELTSELGRPVSAKIFATDVDDQALRVAAAGIYSEADTAAISGDRLQRFFEIVPEGFRVRPEIRELVEFTQHNVVSDAPILNADLVSCRNLLIYLQPIAQKKIVSLFHFSLRQDGILVLGTSESPGTIDSGFKAWKKRLRIYHKHRGTRLTGTLRTPRPLDSGPQKSGPQKSGLPGQSASESNSPAASSADSAAAEIDQMLPASILVNDSFEVMRVFGGAEEYLAFPSGWTNHDIRDFVIAPLQHAIRLVLGRAAIAPRTQLIHESKITIGNELVDLAISVRPVKPTAQTRTYFIQFERSNHDPDRVVGEATTQETLAKHHVEHLENELRATRGDLQSTIEELGVANEELQATNEELMTSNEELHSVNTEYQFKIEELVTANNDINNMLTGTGVGVLFLDPSHCIRRFTSRIATVFGLRIHDIGRPLHAIDNRHVTAQLIQDLDAVQASGEVIDQEVSGDQGETFRIRILPYQSDSASKGEKPALVISLIDVSDLTEATLRAEASERELRTIMESVTESIVVLDRQWNYTFVNQVFCDAFGLKREDVIGASVWELFPEAVDSPFETHFREAMATGQTIRFEERFDRDLRWFQGVCFPSKDRLTVFFSDVTSIRETKSLVEQQGEMLEASHDAIIAWEIDGGITFWNRGAELLYGFCKEEVLGKTTHEVLRTEHPIPLEQIYETMRNSGDWEGNVVHYTKQDQPLRIVTRHQIMNFDDETEVVLEVNRDITDFELLSRQVAQLASIADLTSDFVGTADVDGNTVFVNRGGALMLGYESPEQLRHKTLRDFHPSDTLRRLVDEGYPQAASGEVWQSETEMLGKHGDRIPVSQVLMAHFDSDGQVTHYSTIARDISSQKAYELELESIRDRAEAANRAKSAFLAQMSHEIRTPMTAIIGCAEQLQQSVQEPGNRQLSRVMVEQGQALMSILDDILDLSRIEAEKLDLEIRPTDVPTVLRDLHRLMQARSRETGIDFDFELVGTFPKNVDTDPVRLRQVVVNLLSNAFKFTKEGSVKLSACCVEVGGGWELQINVSDSGVGIPKNQLKKIFEAFSRLQNPDASAPGTGLGLTIANRLVERLGGELDVDSREGHGTTFQIRLPVPSPQQTAYGAPTWMQLTDETTANPFQTDSAAKHIPLHVLVAEDTDAIRFLLNRILGGLVEKLTMVEDGADAVKMVTNPADGPPIDLILMDMQMPVMSGVEATRKIRAQGIEIPIIALTAGAMDADRQHCLKAGCNEFLTKPIDRQQLIDQLERYAAS